MRLMGSPNQADIHRLQSESRLISIVASSVSCLKCTCRIAAVAEQTSVTTYDDPARLQSLPAAATQHDTSTLLPRVAT